MWFSFRFVARGQQTALAGDVGGCEPARQIASTVRAAARKPNLPTSEYPPVRRTAERREEEAAACPRGAREVVRCHQAIRRPFARIRGSAHRVPGG